MLFKSISEHRIRWKSSQWTGCRSVEPNVTVNTLDIKATGQSYFGVEVQKSFKYQQIITNRMLKDDYGWLKKDYLRDTKILWH